MDNEELNQDEIQTPITEELASQNLPEESESVTELEDDSLPFPNARVVRMLRDEIQSGKQIRSEVKVALNEWLGNMLRQISREMDNTPYGSIGLVDFHRATRPFDSMTSLVKDKERIILAVDKLMADADQIKRDLHRFYSNITGKEHNEN